MVLTRHILHERSDASLYRVYAWRKWRMNERIHLSLGGETEIEKNRADWGGGSGDERRERATLCETLRPSWQLVCATIFICFLRFCFKWLAFSVVNRPKKSKELWHPEAKKKAFSKKKRSNVWWVGGAGWRKAIIFPYNSFLWGREGGGQILVDWCVDQGRIDHKKKKLKIKRQDWKRRRCVWGVTKLNEASTGVTIWNYWITVFCVSATSRTKDSNWDNIYAVHFGISSVRLLGGWFFLFGAFPWLKDGWKWVGVRELFWFCFCFCFSRDFYDGSCSSLRLCASSRCQ